MTTRGIRMVVAVAVLGLGLATAAVTQAPAERGDGDPIFMRWLDPASPTDQTIRDYWRRAEAGELTALEMVDLGTMLFDRGWPKDAVRAYERALDLDDDLAEAWFRIGLVKHQMGEIDRARAAYKRCLKRLIGHGWCNFYLALLEEETGHPAKALEHYGRAFKVAPELADPAVNPAVLYSELALGGALSQERRERFRDQSPMVLLQPQVVAEVRSRYEPTPTPTPVGTAAPSAAPQGVPAELPAPESEPADSAAPAEPAPSRVRTRRALPTPTPDVQPTPDPSRPSPYGYPGSRSRTLPEPTGTPTE